MGHSEAYLDLVCDNYLTADFSAKEIMHRNKSLFWEKGHAEFIEVRILISK